MYYEQGYIKKALEYYIKTLEIYKKIYPEDHPETIEVMNDIKELEQKLAEK